MFGESISESPRLPSPWDSRLLTPTGSKTPHADATTSSQQQQHSLIPEEDLSGHIEYKLRLPAHPSVDRLARLTSQLKWRLLEGGGEAIYEVGVCDNGLLLGIDIEEIQYSLATLERMAEGLGATVKVVRRMQVSSEGVKELPLDDAPPIAWLSSVKEEPPIDRQATASVQKPAPVSIPPAPSAPLPPYYINKRRLTKKDRRQVKREKEMWLKSCEAAEESIAGGGRDQDELSFPTFDDNDQSGSAAADLDSSAATSFTSTPAYISVTPPVDEIPQLSHSPSPPSSTSGSQHYTAQQTRIDQTIQTDERVYSLSTTCSMTSSKSDDATPSEIPRKVLPVEISEAEQAQYALRRHLRKQWKKEKQHAKQLERARQAVSTHPSRLRRRSDGLNAASDQYLDGLVFLFDDAVLAVDSLGRDACSVQAAPSCSSPSEPRWHSRDGASHHRRHRRRGPAFSPTSTPLSGTLTPAVALNIAAPTVGSTDRSNRNVWHTTTKRHPAPVVKSASEAPRYAIECVIKMPSACPSRVESDDDDDEAELAFFGGDDTEEHVAPKQTPCDPIPNCPPPGSNDDKTISAARRPEKTAKASRPARERTRLQSFIDFETVWDELEMDL